MNGNWYIRSFLGVNFRKIHLCGSLGLGGAVMFLLGLIVVAPNNLPPSRIITGVGIICLMVGSVLMIPMFGMIARMTLTAWKGIRHWNGWRELRGSINWGFFLPTKPLIVREWNKNQVAAKWKPPTPQDD